MGAFLLPAIAGGASLLSNIFGNKAKQNQANEQAKLYNDWLKQYQGTAQGLMSGAQAAGWNPYGPQTSTSQNTGTSSTSSRGGQQFSNKPQITQEYQPLDELMRGIMTGRLAGGSSLPQGYASNAARAINESYAGADAAARNLAARRGLSGEQAYSVASPANTARAGALADMRGNLPLLERQMQNQDIGITQGLQSAFGRGETGQSTNWNNSTTNSSQQGSQTNPFSASDLNALMHVLAPPGPQQGTQTGVSGLAGGLDSLGALFGFLASQQQGKTAQQPNAQMMNLYNQYPGFPFGS